MNPSQDWFSEVFIDEGRLVTSDMFLIHWGINMKHFWGKIYQSLELCRVNTEEIAPLQDNAISNTLSPKILPSKYYSFQH